MIIFNQMNSQNQYHLSFNPRGQPKQKHGEKQTRYIPQLKQNKMVSPPWRQNANNQYQYEQETPKQTQPETREFKIPLNPNDSGYMSNKSSYSTAKRTQESQKREEERKKDQIIKRVKDLQEKVLPMVDRDRTEDDEAPQTGWQSRIQLKLIRIQTCMDGLRKQWEVQMQKRLAEVQSLWESKFQEIIARTEGY